MYYNLNPKSGLSRAKQNKNRNAAKKTSFRVIPKRLGYVTADLITLGSSLIMFRTVPNLPLWKLLRAKWKHSCLNVERILEVARM